MNYGTSCVSILKILAYAPGNNDRFRHSIEKTDCPWPRGTRLQFLKEKQNKKTRANANNSIWGSCLKWGNHLWINSPFDTENPGKNRLSQSLFRISVFTFARFHFVWACLELINRFKPLETRAPIGHRVAPVGLPRVIGQSRAVWQIALTDMVRAHTAPSIEFSQGRCTAD